MINTQYGGLNSTVTIGKDNDSISAVKACVANNTEALPMTSTNIDRFEHSTSEAAQTYSPEMLVKGSDSIYATSTTSRAATDYQRERIPKFLAAKMAGIRTYSDGSPIINSAYEYNAYQNAQNKISGNHSNLYCKAEYRYSQTGKNSYGNPDPLNSCDTFAFATALSIKYGKKITPDQIVIGSGGFVRDHWSDDADTVYEWYCKDGTCETAYRISASRGNDTLAGIDAQLQLGNPVLIHTSGISAQTHEASEHWATVIGKEDGRYKIIDPYDGSECWLEEMQVYKNGGSILDYTILSDKY